MNATTVSAIVGFALMALAGPSPSFAKCPPDAVQVGPVCVDKYEASAWSIPDPTGANKQLVNKLKKGKATLADLTTAGATQHGCTYVPVSLTAYPPSFPDNGNWTAPVYAASVPGVLGSDCTTWFQAEQACALAGKRLLTNQEWQRAAAGTPDPGDSDDNATQCEVDVPPVGGNIIDPVNTGSRSACVSSWGTFDMVGNAPEWVADWTEWAVGCDLWTPEFGSDGACVTGNETGEARPGAMIRGGSWGNGAVAGVFYVDAGSLPSHGSAGFRCAR
jgi:formylglycine-generating enzyme required for sulfatase activity